MNNLWKGGVNMMAALGGLLGGAVGGLFGKSKTPSAGAAPVAPDPAKVAQQADLDRQRQAAAGASPSTITNVGGAAGTSALTADQSKLKSVVQGF